MARFFMQELFNGVGKAGVSNPVRRAGGSGQQTSRELVLPLSTAFKETQLLRNAELNCLVVAGLEMQAWHVSSTAPVTSIKCVPVPQRQGAGYILPILLRQNQYQRVG